MSITTTTSTNSSNFTFDYNKETGTLYGGTGTNAEPNYREYCWYRLPCGICTRTNEMCPLGKAEISWEITCNSGSGVTYNKNKDNDWFVNLVRDNRDKE